MNIAEYSQTIDWKLCIFCQRFTNEHLQNPSDGEHADAGEGCLTILSNMQRLYKLKCLPITVNLIQLGTQSVITILLNQNGACWHKNRRNKLNELKLE